MNENKCKKINNSVLTSLPNGLKVKGRLDLDVYYGTNFFKYKFNQLIRWIKSKM